MQSCSTYTKKKTNDNNNNMNGNKAHECVNNSWNDWTGTKKRRQISSVRLLCVLIESPIFRDPFCALLCGPPTTYTTIQSVQVRRL